MRLPPRRVNAIQKMIALVQSAGADGMDIDFEPVKDNQTEDLLAFMRDLSAAYRAVAPTGEITIDVYAWAPFYPGYDIRRLTPFVDRFLIMGYNYHWTGARQAGPNSPLTGGKAWKLYVRRSLEDPDGYLALAPLDKIVLGLPYYGYDWPVSPAAALPNATRGTGFTRSYRDLISQAKNARLWDPESQTPYFSYNDAGGLRQVWYEDAQSLALKYDYVKQRKLPGVMIWALGYDEGHSQLWDALQTSFPPLTSVPLPPVVDAGTPTTPTTVDAGTPEPPVVTVDAGQTSPPTSSQPPQGTTGDTPMERNGNAPDDSVRSGYSPQTGCNATNATPVSALLLLLVWTQRARRSCEHAKVLLHVPLS
ncbi:MAG: glycosyl hydrolase family 18 protein [Myxococcaceae bacterium]